MNTPHKINTQSGGLIMNVGIGIVLGLLAALLAVFLVMQGGPFKDKQNNNSLEQTGQSTDPNAPLYGAAAAPPMTTGVDVTGGNAQGEGVAALGAGGESTSTTTETAKPAVVPSADPVAAIIETANKKETKPEPTTEAPKAVKPSVAAPNTPKEVKPVAPLKPADAPSVAQKGKYTIQAGAYNSAAEAAAAKAKLSAQGQSVSITEKKTADGTLYRVRVGSYGSDKEAQAARAKVGGVVLELDK